MYEFYGWISLKYNTHDTKLELQDEAISQFSKYISSLEIDKEIYVMNRKNGIDSFMISGLHNHTSDYCLEIFKWVSQNLPGSYGLLFIHNDEDAWRGIDNTNKFIVWKLARGVLSKEDDPFLSPCIPKIEDEFDPLRDD